MEHQFNNHEQQIFLTWQREGKSIFLTGKAGTGKTTLLKHLVDVLKAEKRKVAIVAPTGIAALQAGGMTIHRFFNLPTDTFINNERKIKPLDDKKLEALQALETLIIDEVSMVRCDLLDAVDLCMRKSLQIDKPFGGKQVIMVGDMFQIPPVVLKQDIEVLNTAYKSPFFFFEARSYKTLNPYCLELQEVFRQKDKDFMTVLDALRVGKFTDAQLAFVNQRYESNLVLESNVIELTTTNALADTRNRMEISKIDETLHVFEAEIEGDFEEKTLPTEKRLELKIGAQVMFVRNHQNGKWANGSIGKIVNFLEQIVERDYDEEEDDFLRDMENEVSEMIIEVLLENGNTVYVNKYAWHKIEYAFDHETQQIEEKVVGKFSQYPVKLAWAITIHKSQGLTFEKVCLNLGNGTFVAGQAYVALSRCRSLEGLQLRTRIWRGDIKTDAEVLQYYQNNLYGQS